MIIHIYSYSYYSYHYYHYYYYYHYFLITIITDIEVQVMEAVVMAGHNAVLEPSEVRTCLEPAVARLRGQKA